MFHIKDIKKFLKNLPSNPGIYQMFDKAGDILYVGKAKNLKKRVASYFKKDLYNIKTSALISKVHKIDVTITASEYEALLLESNLIKQHKPRYNILFKDDKSFPYLVLSKDKFPRLSIYRGPKKSGFEYFGPYPDGKAVYELLDLAEKAFQLRSCKDVSFKNRSRPCLKYQVGRCSAPCVNYINENEYRERVKLLTAFLRGRSHFVIDVINKQMKLAAQNKEYEKAAFYRDQILSLQSLQERQIIDKKSGDFDIVALAMQNDIFCLQILYVRSGKIIGSQTYFPKTPKFFIQDEVLTAFLMQNYLNQLSDNAPPKKIYINIPCKEARLITEALQIEVVDSCKNKNCLAWLNLATVNASEALLRHLALHSALFEKFMALKDALFLVNIPERIECFDISHTGGKETVAGCVVFTAKGPDKNAYRRFNIENIAPNDDYGALNQALWRHFKYLKETPEKMPDVLLIDGGVGQLNIAVQVLKNLEINNVILLSIAKDTHSKNSVDTVYGLLNNEIIKLNIKDQPLLLLQQIRDETHRFTVSSHRQKRSKKLFSVTT